jgi:aminomethyltransferase
MQEIVKKTALYNTHVSLGAKMIPFAGYEMPVRYSSDIEEHKCVREKVGIFDVSHMGPLA